MTFGTKEYPDKTKAFLYPRWFQIIFVDHFRRSVRSHNSNGYGKIKIETKVVSVIRCWNNGAFASVDNLELSIF